MKAKPDGQKTKRPAFAPVIKAITRDPRLSVGAKALYDCLLGHADGMGVCWPKQETLCGYLNCNVKTLRKWTRELEHFRILDTKPKIVRGVKVSNLYMLTDRHFAQFLAKPYSRAQAPKSGRCPKHQKVVGQEVEPLKAKPFSKGVYPEDVPNGARVEENPFPNVIPLVQ